jgi:hypothetical protein
MIQEESLQAKSRRGARRRGRGMNPATVALGALAAVLVGSVVAGVDLPLIGDDRAALYSLAALGFTMCAVGPLRSIAAGARWVSWAGMFGILLGMVALVLVVAAVVGIDLPLIDGDRAAFTALAAVMAAKLGVGVLYRSTG